MPKVVVHNPVLAYENGRRVHAGLVRRRGRQARPVRARSSRARSRNEKLNGEGYWAAIGDDPDTGQPITTNEWVDRLAPKAAAVVARRHLRDLRRHPGDEEQPDRRDGRCADYLGWDWKSKAGLPVVSIPGCPAQPDNMTETLLYLVLHLAGLAPVPELDEALRPDLAVRPHGARELQPRRLLRAGRLRHRVRLRPPLPGQARLQGAGGQVQRARSAAGRTASAAARTSAASAWPARCPGFPDKYMPFMDEDPWGEAVGADCATLHLWRSAATDLRQRNVAKTVRRRARVAAAPDQRHDHRRGLRRAGSRRRPTSSRGERIAMATMRRRDGAEGHRQGDVVGPDHADRRVSLGIHTEIDFTSQKVDEVLLDVDDLPRVRHLHEGDRPARHALHHQPHLRHLR